MVVAVCRWHQDYAIEPPRPQQHLLVGSMWKDITPHSTGQNFWDGWLSDIHKVFSAGLRSCREQKEPCEQEGCQPPHWRLLESQHSAALQLCLNILFRKWCCNISMKKQSVTEHWRLAAGSSSGPNFCGDSDSFTRSFPHFLFRQRLYFF